MKKNSRAGFSLLEILIYIAVIAVVTTAIGGVFLSVAGGQARADAMAEINSNLRFALDKINQDISAASAITTPASAGNTSATLALTSGANQITYCAVNSQLHRGTGGICDGNSEKITSGQVKVDNLSFTRLENINDVLPKTAVSIQTVLTIGYNGANSTLITKQITSSLR
jgi:type II secretory pathway pseudopilin PulG